MVVLRPSDNNPSMSKMKFQLYDTIYDVNDKIEAFIAENNKSSSSTNTDKLFGVLLNCGPLMRFILWFLRLLDRHGWLPKFVTDNSPFHGSAVYTNLASIRTNHIYHHVYDFGTMGMVIAMGNNIETPKTKAGNIVMEKEIPFGIVMDERIADGHYYATAFAAMEKYLRDPSVLEQPPETVNVDFEFETLSERFKTEKTKQKEAKKAEKARKKAEKKEKESQK